MNMCNVFSTVPATQLAPKKHCCRSFQAGTQGPGGASHAFSDLSFLSVKLDLKSLPVLTSRTGRSQPSSSNPPNTCGSTSILFRLKTDFSLQSTGVSLYQLSTNTSDKYHTITQKRSLELFLILPHHQHPLNPQVLFILSPKHFLVLIFPLYPNYHFPGSGPDNFSTRLMATASYQSACLQSYALPIPVSTVNRGIYLKYKPDCHPLALNLICHFLF